MFKFLQRLQYFERNYSSIFWLCVSFLGLVIFHEPIQNPSQSHVVIEQVRGGSRDSEKINLLNKRISLRKRKNFNLTLHCRLEQHFPDWEERIAYQKKQEKFYKSGMRKKRELKRLRIKETPNFYTKEELNAIDYFHGTGFYANQQHPKVKPNIFDTRQSFLLKMHDRVLRNNFLNSLNSENY